MTYGCFNRPPFAESIPVADGWENNWARRMVDMQFRMERGCIYSTSELGQADQKCQGCRWRANGQADTGAGAPSKPEPIGAGVVGICDGQGAAAGESGTSSVQQPAPVAEEQGTGEQARAAEKLEAIYPGAAMYRQVKA